MVVTAAVSGTGTAPYSATLMINNAATNLVPTVNGSTFTFTWDTKSVIDAVYSLAVAVTDATGATATSPPLSETVDNIAPTTYIITPDPNSPAVWTTTTLTAQAHGSDANGIKQLQFEIDGAPVGPVLLANVTPGDFTYSASLDVSKLANGSHTLTDVVTDNAGNTATATPVAFNVGIAPLTVTIAQPPDLSFGVGTTNVVPRISGGTGPYSTVLLVDGAASGAPVTSSPYTLPWNTTTLPDGTHTIVVQVTDSTGTVAKSPAFSEIVDNTAPEATMYQPPLLPGKTFARSYGPTTVQVHASDANGVRSVQFTVDGTLVGTPITAPDTPGGFLYSSSVDTSTLTTGTHSISAVVIDNAGNTTTAAPVTVENGPFLPVLNYHGIDATPPDIYEMTPAEADQQLAYLHDNGYQSVTLEQYQQWLAGADIGIAKPVLITVDDGLTDQLAWDALLQKYGFTAVMFVVTGFVDNTTPGDNGPQNLSWAQLQALAATGRWEMAFHAGTYGHGDGYGSGQTAGGVAYSSTCPYFYTCLGTGESVSAYETAVTSEIAAGVAELHAMIPTASSVAWAAPFDDAGQWTNLYNDPSNAAQSWFPAFMATQFPITFTQTSWVQYGLAQGLVGDLTQFGREYRFEVHTGTTIGQFAAALTDPAFGR